LPDRELQEINEYDNSIAFTDQLLDEALKMLRLQTGRAMLLYYADHGDEVHDLTSFAGHEVSQLSQFMLDVPMVLWVNDTYRRQLPASVARLYEAQTQPYSLEHLIHTVQDLTQIYADRYEAAHSLLHPDFSPEKRRIPGGYYEPMMEAARRWHSREAVDSIGYPTRVWFHRANTAEQLKDVQRRFRGIELDVVFEEENQRFDVRHPPTPHQGFTLENYLRLAEAQGTEFYFWLDYKNLAEENVGASVQRLEDLDAQFDLKKRIVVESTNPLSLQAFHQAGFFTSYYLPDLRNRSQWELQPLIDAIGGYLEKGHLSAISQDIRLYPLMRYYFPRYPKLIWDAGLNGHDPTERARAETLLAQDSTIRVMLVDDFPSSPLSWSP
jgi:heptose-I-phosphate ethanolaminephosphotransferase